VRNNTALVIGAAAGLEFFVKANTVGTVQLGNDNAFSAIDDERTVFSHDREFANKDVVLDFFLELAVFAIFFENLKRKSGVKLHGIREATLTAFGDAVLRDTEIITFIIKGIKTLDVSDRENILEHAFQPYLETFFWRDFLLEELLVRSLLDFDQVREFQLELIGGIAFSLRGHLKYLIR
jgi:hypothetical protein